MSRLKKYSLVVLGLFISLVLYFAVSLDREVKSYSVKSSMSLIRYKKKQTKESIKTEPRKYKIVPPDKIHTILIATNAQGSEWLNDNGYKWTDSSGATSLESLCLENNSELPGMSDVNGAVRHVYFWATPQQANELGIVRINGQIIFFKADNGYLNSLKVK